MKTTLLTRLSALTLGTTLATVATLGVAFMMTDSGERAQLAASQSALTVLTQASNASRAAPTL